ncbi:S-adenosyl-L-methionine-dependent methyltransferase [Haematococcus lacustris]
MSAAAQGLTEDVSCVLCRKTGSKHSAAEDPADGAVHDTSAMPSTVQETLLADALHGMTIDAVLQVTQTNLIRTHDDGVLRSMFLKLSGTGMAPWEIHRPQQVVVRLAQQGVFDGTRLCDLGSGIGDNALYLAKHRTCEVTAVELVERCQQFTRPKQALRRGLEGKVLHWVTADLVQPLQPPLLGAQFDALLDCALFVALGTSDRPQYLANLAAMCRPGGHLYLIVFSDKWPAVNQGGPRRFTPQQLRDCFLPEAGWEVESVEDCMLEHHPRFSKHDPDSPRSWEYSWRGYCESYLAIIRRL